jgi:hypothetical protein
MVHKYMSMVHTLEIPELTENIPFTQFVDTTHAFLKERELLVVANTPQVVLDLFIAEVDELIEALQIGKPPIEVVSEVGDIIHFYNDLLKVFGVVPMQLVPTSTEKDSVAQVRTAVREMIPAKWHENSLKQSLELLKSQASQILKLVAQDNELAEVQMVQGDAQEIELRKEQLQRELSLLLQAIFFVSEKLEVDLVYAGLFKNVRNRSKYPVELFQSSNPADYPKARDESKQRWQESGGDEAFIERFFQKYPIPFLMAIRSYDAEFD